MLFVVCWLLFGRIIDNQPLTNVQTCHGTSLQQLTSNYQPEFKNRLTEYNLSKSGSVCDCNSTTDSRTFIEDGEVGR
ncbi:hypothetical protein [Fischerella sp. FACHB-380]|uniref:hypothetical protein n=1 Tax=Fischerella sp. FACHB-380 TaxID=2692799 RepID=UPI001A7E605A|nr:hypothetical protein [Fischerella sp. FACHB-380]